MSKFKVGDKVHLGGDKTIIGTIIGDEGADEFFRTYTVQWDVPRFRGGKDGVETVLEFILDLVPYSVEGFEV